MIQILRYCARFGAVCLSYGRGRPKLGNAFWLMAALALLPLAVLAHAQLKRSIPSNRAELAKSPTQVELWFNELLEDGFKSVTLFPAEQLQSTSRTNLVVAKPELDENDRTHLSTKVKPLTPGEYVVEWRVLSRDGHSAPGRITFKVMGAK